MIKFSANVSWIFIETDFLNRFERAAKAGFKGVECMSPFEWEKEAIAEQLQKHDLEMVMYNLPAGNWGGGERGIACLPNRTEEFRASVGKAIEYAKALKCSRINCLSGITPKGFPAEQIRKTEVENLRFAARTLEKENIKFMLEAINYYDMPGFYVNNTAQALDLIQEVNEPNLWLQYDIYHMQMMEGNLTKTIRENVSRIAHIQLGDVPGRHEPGTGEINFPNLFRFIEEAGYQEWIGLEYKPAGVTEDGLRWMQPYVVD